MPITLHNMRVYAADKFRESLNSNTNSMYVTFGKTLAWTDDNDPPEANNTIQTQYDVWKSMVGGKRIFASDIRCCIPRHDWTANTIYDIYDDADPDLFEDKVFYTVTSDYNVYKCIDNNGGANSTVEPISTNPATTTELADGYIWKYMYTISDAELLRFTTSEYIPVKTLSLNDGSSQWQVQSNAEGGRIISVVVSNVGVNYSNTSNLSIVFDGDGEAAAANVYITAGNTIDRISMTDTGRNYSYATASITGGGGSGANVRPVISPIGGNGKNALYELGGRNIIINTKIKNTEGGIFPVDNDFRQICLLHNPRLESNTLAIAANTTFVQAYRLTTVGSGSFFNDETVFQGPSYFDATFRATVLDWDATTGVVTIINRYGELSENDTLTGVTSSVVRYIQNTEENQFEEYSGNIIYIDNIEPISRAEDQNEDIKIVIQF
jgi:hypothetical protein